MGTWFYVVGFRLGTWFSWFKTMRSAPRRKLQFYGNMGLCCRFSIGNVVVYVNATQACWWHLGGGDRRVLTEDLAVKSAPKWIIADLQGYWQNIVPNSGSAGSNLGGGDRRVLTEDPAVKSAPKWIIANLEGADKTLFPIQVVLVAIRECWPQSPNWGPCSEKCTQVNYCQFRGCCQNLVPNSDGAGSN